MTTQANHAKAAILSQQWRKLEQREPRLFPNEIAALLHVSEAELLASRIGEGITLLNGDWDRILSSLRTLGPVKTVTRNRSAVMEKTGTYPRFERCGAHGLFLGESIDLRLSLEHWAFAFSVEKAPKQEGGLPSRSVQFFNKQGETVHKAFLLRASSVAAYEKLVHDYRAEAQLEIAPQPLPALSPEWKLNSEQRERFLAAWSALEDTHDFFHLLGQFHIERPSAYRIAEGRYTRRVSNHSAVALLRYAAKTSVPLAIFAGNRDCLQVHKGPLHNIVGRGDWVSAMEKGSEFHLKPREIASSWVVEKPTQNGAVLSLEIFDRSGSAIARFFGIRKEGRQQSSEWLTSIASLA